MTFWLDFALDDLHGPLSDWVYSGTSSAKRDLFAAYSGLPAQAKAALAQAVRKAFGGASSVVMYRRTKSPGEIARMGGVSLTTELPGYVEAESFEVTPDDVLIHHAIPNTPLNSKAFGHEREVVLKPDASPKYLGPVPSRLASRLAARYKDKKQVPKANPDRGGDGIPKPCSPGSGSMTLAARIAQRYHRRAGLDTPGVEEALGALTVGLGLLVAQNVIVTHPFYAESEIRKYLAARREFHPLFAQACMTLADNLEGTPLASTAEPLRHLGKLGPQQTQQALVGLGRILRGLVHLRAGEVDPRLLRLLRTIYRFTTLTDESSRSDEYYRPSESFKDVLEGLVKYSETPPKLKTLFRKVLSLGAANVGNVFSPEANPGAWFDMKIEERVALRAEIAQVKQEQDAAIQLPDADARYKAYQRAAFRLVDVQARAGVNAQTIQQEEREPLEKVLRRESKQEVDSPTEWVVTKLIEQVESHLAEYESFRKSLSRREWGKLRTLLRQARTLGTVRRIVQEAEERKILSRDYVENLDKMVSETQKNIAVKSGVPLVPLVWEPKTPDAFRALHDVGEIEFPGDMPEEKQHETLGRVSRALSDLEMVYGTGFCGKHAKKLAFRFGAGDFLAKASYFGWDNRNRWQPRVKFGEDYEGLLAHELSHYMEDLIAYRVEKVFLSMPEYEYGDVAHGRGYIFGLTGIVLERSLEFHQKGVAQGASFESTLDQNFPEIREWMEAVVKSPAYARWGDYVGASVEMMLGKAIKNVTGKDPYEDKTLESYLTAEFKSQIPPEIVAEAERLYAKSMGGDTRKLSYYQSSTEVWARMCEQYTYTKLGKTGIVNPWLTHMTYEGDAKFMEQDYFEEHVAPIMDRLFAKLKGKGVLARRLRAGAFDADPCLEARR